MSEPDASPDSPAPGAIDPQDVLPDVKPPTAGFILQLFFIPGMIVMVIVMVWLLFNWLARSHKSPEAYLEAIRKNQNNSWQVSHDLAIEMRRNPEYQKNGKLAREVAAVLEARLDQPLPKRDPKAEADKHSTEPRSQEVNRRGFLCKLLGEFRVDDGLPVLLRAAGPHADDDEAKVRLAALEAIAVLAHNCAATGGLKHQELLPTLLAASRDDERVIKIAGLFALGVVGGEEALARLEEVVVQPGLDEIRCNAATGLARHGRPACLDVLSAMLDPEQSWKARDESKKIDQQAKQARIILNGLRAARQFAEANETADVSRLIQAVETLQQADIPPQLRVEAKGTLAVLRSR